MKLLSLMFIGLIGISFSGCTWCEVEVPKPYPVPVECKPIQVDCNEFKGTGDSIEEELGMCIHEMKEAGQVCAVKDK